MFLGFSFAEEKRVCTEYWIFYSRHVVFEEAYCLFFILAALILSDPNCKYHKQNIYCEEWVGLAAGLLAPGWGGSGSNTSRTRGSADMVTGGFECGLLLELEHFWNRGLWEVLLIALF